MSHLQNTKNIALNTDLYQLTMGQAYLEAGREDDEAVFNLFFREAPFENDWVVAAGLGTAIEYIKKEFFFSRSDLEYLSELTGNDGEPLFKDEYLEYLRDMEFECDIKAVKEGTIVFPHEPMVRVEGPIIQAQLLETALLNCINYQTLVATKAARISRVANGPVLEFGLRRAQGMDGGLSAARGAYIGGAAGTSNVLAGKRLGIPVKGTHAHSWVQSFDVEQDAFDAFARSQPNNAVLLVDTYDTIEGVKKAVKTAQRLREEGYEIAGVRLDSGDLAELSKKAREILDDAGFEDAKIIASDGLDEHKIKDIQDRGGKVDAYGVGTNLVTCKGDPALGGVYKLGGIRKPDGTFKHKIKLSDTPIKTSIPGRLSTVRWRDRESKKLIAGMIYDEEDGGPDRYSTLVSREDHTALRTFNRDNYDLIYPMVQVFEDGEHVRPRQRDLSDKQDYTKQQLKRVDEEEFQVGLEPELSKKRKEIIDENSKAQR